MGWLIIALVIVVGAGILLLPLVTGRASAPAGFDRLVALCHNDREMAERLVAGEERRRPGRPRAAQIQAAIERLQDDRRR